MTPTPIVKVVFKPGGLLPLTPMEAYLSRVVAANKRKYDVDVGAVSYGPQDPIVIVSNMSGASLAEWAVARHANVWPSTQTRVFEYYNLTLSSGDRVQVQLDARDGFAYWSVAREARRLKKGREGPCLHMVLQGAWTEKQPYFIFAGWTTHERLLAAPTRVSQHGVVSHCLQTLDPRPLELWACPFGGGWRAGQEDNTFDFMAPDAAP